MKALRPILPAFPTAGRFIAVDLPALSPSDQTAARRRPARPV